MYEAELREMILACKKASKQIMEIYHHGFHIKTKEDNSPVTDADLASDKIIRSQLNKFSDVAWLSEEDADDMTRLDKQALFIIDPLDGTQDFVEHDDSFGINIALVVHHHPVRSVVGVPAQNAYAYALLGKGSYLVKDDREERLHVSDRTNHLILVMSKTHLLKEEEDVINRHKDIIEKTVSYGASIKSIALARGDVDASVRYTDQTKEWDVCAPELIVTEAGGIFMDTKKRPFTYNRKDVYNHDGYCMFNRKENEILLQ